MTNVESDYNDRHDVEASVYGVGRGERSPQLAHSQMFNAQNQPQYMQKRINQQGRNQQSSMQQRSTFSGPESIVSQEQPALLSHHFYPGSA